MSTTGARQALEALLGPGAVLMPSPAAYLADETEQRGLAGRADSVALPSRTAEVARVVRCCRGGRADGQVRRIARESGLPFPPDPGAAAESQLGGNIATNAGGPHA
jgi:FAD/FMN-containing dehydrogenase